MGFSETLKNINLHSILQTELKNRKELDEKRTRSLNKVSRRILECNQNTMYIINYLNLYSSFCEILKHTDKNSESYDR